MVGYRWRAALVLSNTAQRKRVQDNGTCHCLYLHSRNTVFFNLGIYAIIFRALGLSHPGIFFRPLSKKRFCDYVWR